MSLMGDYSEKISTEYCKFKEYHISQLIPEGIRNNSEACQTWITEHRCELHQYSTNDSDIEEVWVDGIKVGTFRQWFEYGENGLHYCWDFIVEGAE